MRLKCCKNVTVITWSVMLTNLKTLKPNSQGTSITWAPQVI